MDCIILAGGLGTRLRNAVPDLPKCLAPVNGKPFLEYILSYLEDQNCDHVILSLGYKYEQVLEWIKTKAFTFKVSWVIEKEPLGTGGGIKRALSKCKSSTCFVINGDTLFDINLKEMQALLEPNIKAVIALKPMQNFERYGSVDIDDKHTITTFNEKQACEEGLINGGVYLLNNSSEILSDFPEKFSFEKDFLEPEAQKGHLKAYITNSYFIDMGVEEDYEKAKREL